MALQKTLYEMGKAVLEAHTEVAETSIGPNVHHIVDDCPLRAGEPNEVFPCDDRPTADPATGGVHAQPAGHALTPAPASSAAEGVWNGLRRLRSSAIVATP